MKAVAAALLTGALLWPAAAEAHTLSLGSAKARIQAVARALERTGDPAGEILATDQFRRCTRRSAHRVTCEKYFEVERAGAPCTLSMTAAFRSHRSSRAGVSYPSHFDCGARARVRVPSRR